MLSTSVARLSLPCWSTRSFLALQTCDIIEALFDQALSTGQLSGAGVEALPGFDSMAITRHELTVSKLYESPNINCTTYISTIDLFRAKQNPQAIR